MIWKCIHIEDVIDQKFLIAFSQPCYTQMSDLSGTELTAGQLTDLEQAACNLIDSLPQAYQDSFAVLDYGFYLHNRSMDQGVEDIWPEVIQAADSISPYYLLLGRVPGRKGEVKVEVKFFDNCFTEYDIHSLSRAINSEFNSRDVDVTEKLTFAITEFVSRAEKKLNCCVSQQKKSSSAIDTSYLELALFIDNACCPVLAYERPVAVVSSFPTMPQIEYILEYNTSLNSCVDLNAEIIIYFGRETAVDERDRKDTLRFNYYLLDLNTKYSIDFQDQFQGGRVVLF